MKFGNHLLRSFLFSIIGSIGLVVAVQASESAWVKGKSAASQVRIFSQLSSLAPNSSELLLGLEFRLEPGWHVYWKNPGDVGYAPKLQWQLPETWSASSLFYPAPKELPAAGAINLTSYGYENQVLFPVYIEGQKTPSKAFPIQLKLDYLVCKEQCIPEKANLSLNLPISSEQNSQHSARLDKALEKLPTESNQFEASWLNEKELKIKFHSVTPQLIAFHSEGIKGKFWKSTDLSTNEFQIEFLKKPISDLELIAVQGETSLTGIISLPESTWSSSFFWALFLAFLGGLILNLMPCVLPVVVMKTSFLLQVREQGGSFRNSLALTVLGILCSFLLLGLVTGLLRGFGQQVGWGFQFQNPAFIIFLIVILFVFTLNLFEVFDFNLPVSWSSKMASRSGAFFEGVFATILATPCSAPFLGTALSYALSQNLAISLLFFLSMSLGLALPYIVFLIYPPLLQLLPKPGSWMNALKKFLAYSLMFVILWLLYLVLQLTTSLFVILFIGALLLSFLFIREFKRPWKWGVVSILAVALMYGSLNIERIKSEVSYTVSNLMEELHTGETLFVYVTADWCITCKFNEATVIHTEWFKNYMAEKNIKVRKIDWTERNDDVGSFLEKFNRVGIPFAMLTKNGRYQLFPELLTKSLTQDTVEDFLSTVESKPSLPLN